jgi:hypothetical protein
MTSHHTEVTKAEPMGNSAKVSAALAAHAPNVKTILDTFAANPKIKAYLAARGKQIF